MVQEMVSEGVGVLWSTAYLDEAELCGEVILLNEGQALFAGPPTELTASVADRTFCLPVHEGRRKILARALQEDSIVDGVRKANGSGSSSETLSRNLTQLNSVRTRRQNLRR
jgi:ABC-2 type transport system ATP-binding protein